MEAASSSKTLYPTATQHYIPEDLDLDLRNSLKCFLYTEIFMLKQRKVKNLVWIA
jgi:hypothetical protein